MKQTTLPAIIIITLFTLALTFTYKDGAIDGAIDGATEKDEWKRLTIKDGLCY